MPKQSIGGLVMSKILLQIDTCLNCGSTGHIAENIGLMAKQRGYECYIAHGSRYINRSQHNSIQVLNTFQEVIHGLYSLLLDRHGLASEQETSRLIQIIKEINPDIIQLHCLHGYYLNYEILFRYLASVDIPIVWTFHDCWAFTGHCAHFDFIGCEKWKTGCFECPQIDSYPRSLFVDNSKNNYLRKKESFTSVRNMTIVPVSQWLGGLVKQSFLKSYPIRVIHNGVDLQTFTPEAKIDLNERFRTHKKKYILGVAAPWGERKGFRDFIELSKVLNSNEFQIILVGLSDKQIANLPSRIIGLKRTQNAHELANYYAGANVFVNPTYEDTFPTTNLEALACGTPVITYRTGGSPEAIDESTGIVVPKGDINALAGAIIRFKTSQFLHEACRQRAKRLFDKDKCFDKYVAMYDSLVK